MNGTTQPPAGEGHGGARVVSSFPRPVVSIENQWIPGHDGLRLAARLWLPEDAHERPVPAIVEYVPYRKRDGTRVRDEVMHRWFAGHGYACVRIDVRGTGESEGLLADEYTAEEHADGEAAIEWVAAQPWCSGSVGMLGKSWGGFNSLQIAALAPPALKAVITVASTDDRYADDAHYMGGCLLNENLVWGSALFTLAAQPPDPRFAGEAWRARWLERIDALPLYAERWLRHPLRDDYWRHGSVCEDYAAIRCPVFAVGGWADAYTNAIPRLLAGLGVPRKGLVGPWAHQYPHRGRPGPAIGFLQEAKAWWDRWLRDGQAADAGLADGEPAYRVWMQEGLGPGDSPARRSGRWVAERAWPSPRIGRRRLFLRADGLSERPAQARSERTLCSPSSVGRAAGAWCGFGLEGDEPGDQALDAEGSLLFDSPPLSERLECLGAPVVELELTSDRARAQLAVRLEDLAPDGRAERVTYGLLNLVHASNEGARAFERPAPLVPGRPRRVRVALNHVAHAFAPGRRIRLALSSAYWPIAWPTPERATLRVALGGDAPGALDLPLRPASPEDERLPPFGPPEGAPPPLLVDLEPGGVRARSYETHDGELVKELAIDTEGEQGIARTHFPEIDLVHGHALTERFGIRPDDPLSARVDLEHHTLTARGAWSTRVRTRTALRATREAFRLTAELEAWEGDRRLRRRTWDVSVPREWI